MSRAHTAREHTLHGVVIWPFVDAVRKLGTEVPGLSELISETAGKRITHELASTLLDAAVALTGRADLGVIAAEAVEPGHFELVELASRTQRSVGEGLATLASLVPILHDGLSVELARAPQLSTLRVALEPGLRVHPAGYDFIAASLVIAGRRQTGDAGLRLLRVRLPYARPAGAHPLSRLVGCELDFDGDALELGFPTELLDLPLMRANASMSQVLAQAARELLQPQQHASSELVRAVRKIVADGLAGGALDARTVARKLHTSERTLRRKLDAEGIGLRALIDDVRRELAFERLADDALSTDEIAAQLGFTTAQALHRAFRRWTGGTVQAFRARTARSGKRRRPS